MYDSEYTLYECFMNYYPVLIPTVNRYEHLKKCVDSLKNNTHADKTELVIILDYPANENYRTGWNKIKNYLPSITGFKLVTIIEREKNYYFSGELFNDIKELMLDKYGAIICTEDDNIFSPCFLDYMNKCLDRYKDDDSIVGISGYTPPLELEINSASVFKYCDPKPWGYGIWKHKETKIINDLSNNYLKIICDNKKMLSKFENNLAPLYALRQWSAGVTHLALTSDIFRYCYNISNDKYTIHPLISLVRNEGHDGTGVHCDKNISLSKQVIAKNRIFDVNDNISIDDNAIIQERMDLFFYNIVFQTMQQYSQAKMMYKLYMQHGYEIGEDQIDKYLSDEEERNRLNIQRIEIIEALITETINNEYKKNILLKQLAGKKIVVFGKGYLGKKIYLFLLNILKVDNIEIWDNIGGVCEFDHETVNANIPHHLNNIDDYYVIITPINYCEEIMEQLKNLKFDEGQFISIWDFMQANSRSI